MSFRTQREIFPLIISNAERNLHFVISNVVRNPPSVTSNAVRNLRFVISNTERNLVLYLIGIIFDKYL